MKNYCIVFLCLIVGSLNATIFPIVLDERGQYELSLQRDGSRVIGAEVKSINGQIVKQFTDCKPYIGDESGLEYTCTNGIQRVEIFAENLMVAQWIGDTPFEVEFFVQNEIGDFYYQAAPYRMIISADNSVQISVFFDDEYVKFDQCSGGLSENQDKSFDFNLSCTKDDGQSVTVKGHADIDNSVMNFTATWVSTNQYDPDNIFNGAVDISELRS